MIDLQIVEKQGVNLYKILVHAMRSGELRTFFVQKRGKRVTHARYRGWMNRESSQGFIHCQVLSPKKPNDEWKFVRALIGRLADRYAGYIASITLYFPNTPLPKTKKRKRKKH